MVDSNPSSIEDKLPQAWRQQRRYYHLRGASRFLIWLIFMIAIDFAIDWGIFFQIRLTTRLGLLLLGINVVVLSWVLWHEWLRHLKPYNPLMVALEIEAKHPELSSLLVSYTQLKGPDEKQPDVSVELIEAMRQEAVLKTRTLDFREIVNFGQLRNLLLVAGVVFVVFSGLSVYKQGHLKSLVYRLAGLNVTYPTKTQLVEGGISGDLTVRAGATDATAVVAEVTGVIPDEGRDAQIYTRPVDGDGTWTALPLDKDKNQPQFFRREFKDLVKDLYYYVRIGDAQSEEYRIHVVPAPQIIATRIDLSYPAYMDRKPDHDDQLNLEVPARTTIEWHLTCDSVVTGLQISTDRPNKDYKGDPEDEKYVTIEATITGKQVTFPMLADDGFKYTFHWTRPESGADGKSFTYDDVQHSVRVIADAVPEVELVRPASDGLATMNKTVAVEARANDDHGLGEAWLVYSLDGSAEKEVPLDRHDFKGQRGGKFTFSWKLNSIKELKPGVRISYAVIVDDRSPDAKAHRRRSATRQFTVVDSDRYLQWHRGEVAAAQRDEIKRVRDAERVSSVQVKRLRAQETKTP